MVRDLAGGHGGGWYTGRGCWVAGRLQQRPSPATDQSPPSGRGSSNATIRRVRIQDSRRRGERERGGQEPLGGHSQRLFRKREDYFRERRRVLSLQTL